MSKYIGLALTGLVALAFVLFPEQSSDFVMGVARPIGDWIVRTALGPLLD